MMATDATSPVSSTRQMFRGTPGFAGATLGLILVSGFLLSLFFRGEGDGRAIAISGVVAAAVQIAAYPLVRRLGAINMMVGWGVGSLFRLVSLGAYAAIAALVLHLPMPAALISVALFYFLSMIIEPLFLRS